VATAAEDRLSIRRNPHTSFAKGPVPPGGYLIAGEWLHPKAQPRELSVDNPQLVFRVGFVEPVDQPDQRADVLLGLLKELVGGRRRLVTISPPSVLRLDDLASAARFR
jgi:hypothetical protein